jgi:hypothetical protein
MRQVRHSESVLWLTGSLCSALLAIANRKSKVENRFARVAKLADAPDLGSGGEILRGSSPLPGTSEEVKSVKADERSLINCSGLIRGPDSNSRRLRRDISSFTRVPPISTARTLFCMERTPRKAFRSDANDPVWSGF